MNLDRWMLVAAIVAFGTLSLLVVLPLLQYVLLAVLLGYVLYPLHRRLTPRVGSGISAGGLVAATALVVLLPLGALVTVATQQALQVLEAVRTGQLGLSTIERFLREQVGISTDISGITSGGLDPAELFGLVEQQGGTALFGSVVSLFGNLSNVVIGLTVLVFLTYYLLADGAAFMRWLRGVTPVEDGVWSELVARVDQLLWAVLVGNVAVAVVQGVLTGIGLAIIGFPNLIFWSVVTVILSLLPLIGASVVWIPAAGYLFIAGRPVAAVLLFVYGATVVSLSDNYLRPMVGGREAGLNPGLFVLGIFGGLFVFGFMGVFFGPIVLGVLKVVVELFAREHSRDHPSGRLTASINTPRTVENDRRAS